jgi:hypothetical protein
MKRFGNIIMIQEQLHATLGKFKYSNSAIAPNNGIITGHNALSHNCNFEQDSMVTK